MLIICSAYYNALCKLSVKLLLHIFTVLPTIVLAIPAVAQIVPNGLGTQVERNGSITNISGGKRGGNNLFHSFGQFNVQTGETANFLSQPTIQNILARVNGGSISYINGLIQVLGGNSNLYLMNPAGIIFGTQAQLNVPAAFIATTARQVQFPGGTFGMDTVNVENLSGNPTALLDFGNGSIKVEGSHLNAPGGIALLAGQGGLTVEGAKITSDKGVSLISRSNGYVEVRTQGNILGFEVRQDQLAQTSSVYQLPELLTNGGTLDIRNSSITGSDVSLQSNNINIANTGISGDIVRVGDRTTDTLVFDSKSSILSNGGTVELIAKNTEFAGIIENIGGFVEVSGTEVLQFTGTVKAGTLLIDPTNLWIIEDIYQVPTGTSILTPNTLITQLKSGNVALSATSEIKIPFVGKPIDFAGVPTGRKLTLQDAPTITIERGFINSDGLILNLLSPNAVVTFTMAPTETVTVAALTGSIKTLIINDNLTIGGGKIIISGNNTLTPPNLKSPQSPESLLTGLQVSQEGDILLRNQQQSLLAIAPTLSALEQVIQTDIGLQTRFGLTGLDPVNNFSISEVREVFKQAEEQGKGRTALVYWWFRDGNLTIATVLPKGITEQTVFLRTVNINAREVERVVGEFVFTIKDPRQRTTTNYRASAQKLYSWLIAPLEPIFAQYGITTLIIVADENLRTIPYRALWDGQQYLVEKYRLAQIPSINLVNLDLVSRPIIGATVAMGASEFGGVQPPLPAVPVELEQVAQITRGQKKLNEAFTSQAFTQAWRSNPGFAFHVATHAEFSPSRSYIQFFDGAKPFEALRENLTVNPAELVVLSACQTAIGSAYAELGFAGMAVRLGAKRAIGSLWYVEDVATLALMNDFYRRLQSDPKAPIISEALQQAQVNMIRGNLRIQNQQLVGDGYTVPLPPTLRQDNIKFTHPYYWAAFNLLGNPF